MEAEREQGEEKARRCCRCEIESFAALSLYPPHFFTPFPTWCTHPWLSVHMPSWLSQATKTCASSPSTHHSLRRSFPATLPHISSHTSSHLVRSPLANVRFRVRVPSWPWQATKAGCFPLSTHALPHPTLLHTCPPPLVPPRALALGKRQAQCARALLAMAGDKCAVLPPLERDRR